MKDISYISDKYNCDLDRLSHILEFVNKCRIGRPIIKFSIYSLDPGFGLYPIYKLKLTARINRKMVNRTILDNKQVLPELLLSFGIKNAKIISNDMKTLLDEDIQRTLTNLQANINRAFHHYKTSPNHFNDVEKEKQICRSRLLKRMETEVSEKFRVMLMLGESESSITSLFRTVEIERVINT